MTLVTKLLWLDNGAEEVGQMEAKPGDRIVIKGHRVGEPSRDCLVLEVRSQDGGPPYLVRWEDDHESLFFPGPDASVVHYEHAKN
jgi:hypothetical protein